MIQKNPAAIDTHRARLLMGQELFERKMFDDALKYLAPARDSAFVFEKNLAKYRTAQIYTATDKPKDAMKLLEEVVVAQDLEQSASDQGTHILMADRGSENLKHEALLESTRIFPTVFPGDSQPVNYYLKLAPSEEMFQDAIEKLAYRYISLKRYALGGALLRALSERLGDPERVMNIYRQVLISLPPADRLEIPAQEVVHVLDLFNRWLIDYQSPESVRKSTRDFFETQTRDLGTRSHEQFKATHVPELRRKYLEQARDFYLLYLRYFQNTPYSDEIATNLADIYYNQGDFFRSGETYFRVYSGEFGVAHKAGGKGHQQQVNLLKSAIFSFQQHPSHTYSFYEQTRNRALLMRAIDGYMHEHPPARSDVKLLFVYDKTLYEQGIYNSAIPRLFDFLSKHKSSAYVSDAADLILDYYNTLNDLKGLTNAAGKILALNLPDSRLNQRIKAIQSSASFKHLEQNIQNKLGYGNAAESKQYLQAALSSGDMALTDAALKEALSLSRSEKDTETFFRSAEVLVIKQQDETKKVELLNSVAGEYIKLTRFITATQTLERITSGNAEARSKTFAGRVRIFLMMHDMNSIARIVAHSGGSSMLDADLTKRIQSQAIDLMTSGGSPPESVLRSFLVSSDDESVLQLLFRSQGILSPGVVQGLKSSIQKRCAGGGGRGAICRWGALEAAEPVLARYLSDLTTAPATPEAIEPKGAEFVRIDKIYRDLDGSGDAYVDSWVAIKSALLYSKFSAFLLKVGQKNPALAAPLQQKAGESSEAAKKFRQSCQNIAASAGLPAGQAQYCNTNDNVKLGSYFARSVKTFNGAPARDPSSKKISDLQKELFANEDQPAPLLAIAQEYYNMGEYAHAAATAGYGISLNVSTAEDLKVTLGCSLARLGYLGEAKYQLGVSKSSDPKKVGMSSRGGRSLKKIKKRTMNVGCLGLLALLGTGAAAADKPAAETKGSSGTFVDDHPVLKDYVSEEHHSNFSVGMGIIPIGFMKNRLFFGVDLFEINYSNRYLDWNILDTILGFGLSQGGENGKYVMLMTQPKFRVTQGISVGFLLGYEFVSFPSVQSVVTVQSNGFSTPSSSFGTSAPIYGLSASETIKAFDSSKLKVSQMFFKETYSTTQPVAGATYDFSPTSSSFDPTSIQASTVFMIELSFMF